MKTTANTKALPMSQGCCPVRFAPKGSKKRTLGLIPTTKGVVSYCENSYRKLYQPGAV